MSLKHHHNSNSAASAQSLSFDDIADFFSLPLDDAASTLGICTSNLKKICRENGLDRWPHRRFLAGKSVEEIKRHAARERRREIAELSKAHRQSHIAVECNSTTMCWNCKEPGHLAGQFPYEPVCNMCGKMGHLARDCLNPRLPAHDARLCNNCYKAGHFAADCTNEKACNNCHKIGHLGHDCHNKPVCNISNISGHVARQCAKSKLSSDIGGHFRDIVCRNCGQLGHISQDCVSIVICSNCGGRGHLHYECPSARMYDRSGVRRY
ncbi:hypothetical protein ES288_D03G071000v1 [Gossypium darwinii]|uniref:CCHC-type domain-containing protein n=1 Tax=Gossypium darwinii TaxID=34276 RepID=A0A5D2D5Z6_GOSDA|nr:hypothetical protein ES288_D03G071000v1 [Gossypium darwinii]